MKVTIIGNSVALRVRPSRPISENKNYTYLLREHFKQKATVENIALGASTVEDWLTTIDHTINHFPDIYIIHLGVVDATVREVPLWFYRLSTKKIDNFYTRICKGLYRGPIAEMRPLLARIRGSKSWVNHCRFQNYYEELLKILLKETNAKIITLPICLANERIEKQLPGSRKNQKKFNQIIKNLTEKHRQNHIELNDLNSEQHYPDGVHFNINGHKVVASRLISLIDDIKSSS